MARPFISTKIPYELGKYIAKRNGSQWNVFLNDVIVMTFKTLAEARKWCAANPL